MSMSWENQPRKTFDLNPAIEVKYLTFEMLSNINESAVNAGRNRTLYMDILPIDVEKHYPVKLAFVHNEQNKVSSSFHNDVEIRAEIILNEKGDSCFLDMSLEEYEQLPNHIVDEDTDAGTNYADVQNA